MIPRLEIVFPLQRQWQFWFGKEYEPHEGEYLLNHARTGIYLALQAALPSGGKVGVMAYNCDTVMNPVIQAGCEVVFLDVNEDLSLNVSLLEGKQLDAIVVSNLFGIRNDIDAIRKACPKAIIIVDNAHGYGLPIEGDFTVYSINQGKYPALGPGGILVVNNKNYTPVLGTKAQNCVKIYLSMLVKAFMYHPWIYGWLTQPMKAGKKPKSGAPEPIKVTRMCPGVSRMYNAWEDEHQGQDVAKPFMDIVRTSDPDKTIAEYRAKGIEAETHFKHWPLWAAHYGYVAGSCPVAERLINELVMVPNYYKKQ